MPKLRTGTIYAEITNSGTRAYGQRAMKNRWVAEIRVDGKRHRFRSTSYANVRRWLDDMIMKYPVYCLPAERHPVATTARKNSICAVRSGGVGRSGKNGGFKLRTI